MNPAPHPAESPVKTVLVVEDDEVQCAGLATILRGEGYAVITAANADEGLAYLRADRPDLVLLDMIQPGHDGWFFLTEYRRDPARTKVPVIITTSLSVASPEWARSLGAAGCFRKPLPVPALLDEIRRLAPPDSLASRQPTR
jgi:CheY-like chemotaxis protein